MAQGVGQRLLHDPVRGRAGRRGHPAARCADGQVDPGPGGLRGPYETGQRRQVRQRSVRLVSVAAQHLQGGAQFGACLPAGVGDVLQRPGDRLPVEPVRVDGQDVRGHRGLDADQRDAVGQQVVQVAGDPQPLLGDPAPGLLLAGPFGAFGALQHGGDVLAVDAHIDTAEQHGDDPPGDPQQLQAFMGVDGEHHRHHDGEHTDPGQQRAQRPSGHRHRVEGDPGLRHRCRVRVVERVVRHQDRDHGDQGEQWAAPPPHDRYGARDQQHPAEPVRRPRLVGGEGEDGGERTGAPRDEGVGARPVRCMQGVAVDDRQDAFASARGSGHAAILRYAQGHRHRFRTSSGSRGPGAAGARLSFPGHQMVRWSATLAEVTR